MLAVGLWAAQRGGRAVWAVPLGFVTVMAVGGIVGALGVGFPVVEPAIAVSVLLLGLAVAAAVRWSPAASVLVVAVFALFHGHAHGAEMPPTASGFAYGAGFVLATGFLHGVGISVGWWVQQCGKAQWLRYAGGGIALCGAYLLFR
jgi:urease accessory protein